jgi:hypothetical protein
VISKKHHTSCDQQEASHIMWSARSVTRHVISKKRHIMWSARSIIHHVISKKLHTSCDQQEASHVMWSARSVTSCYQQEASHVMWSARSITRHVITASCSCSSTPPTQCLPAQKDVVIASPWTVSALQAHFFWTGDSLSFHGSWLCILNITYFLGRQNCPFFAQDRLSFLLNVAIIKWLTD